MEQYTHEYYHTKITYITLEESNSLAAYAFLNNLHFLANKNRVIELGRLCSNHSSYLLHDFVCKHLIIYKNRENSIYPVRLSQRPNEITYEKIP